MARDRHQQAQPDRAHAVRIDRSNARQCLVALRSSSFVPLGGIATEYSDSPGAIYVSESTYEALLTEIATDLKIHGFKSIVMIGDHSPDAEGMQAVADRLTAQWHGKPAIVHVPEFFKSWDGVVDILYKKGLGKAGVTDGLHDDPTVTMIMMQSDPRACVGKSGSSSARPRSTACRSRTSKRRLLWARNWLTTERDSLSRRSAGALATAGR